MESVGAWNAGVTGIGSPIETVQIIRYRLASRPNVRTGLSHSGQLRDINRLMNRRLLGFFKAKTFEFRSVRHSTLNILTMTSTPFSLNVSTNPNRKGSCKDFEAAFARRAMILLRRLLGSSKLTELLQDEIAASNNYWREISEKSKGNWRPSRVRMSVRGITTEDFIAWFLPPPDEKEVDPEKLAAHPEHWVLTNDEESKRLYVLETLGNRVSEFWLALDITAPNFVESEADLNIKMPGRGFTKDGVHVIESYHQFKTHEDKQGLDADLAVYFPAACDDSLIETHTQHLLVEFSNWFQQAYDASKVGSSTRDRFK